MREIIKHDPNGNRDSENLGKVEAVCHWYNSHLHETGIVLGSGYDEINLRPTLPQRIIL
ncbi:MAG TPA: hypothetical protein VL996_07335 [Methylocella sp.]|nr:hypothetical protein [Methylocella sp.]